MRVKLQSGLTVVLAWTCVNSVATAQEADARDSASILQEVIVTGSRVARSGFDTPTPTAIVSNDDIMAAGVTDIGRVLQETPQISIGLGDSSDSFSRDLGSSFINLRGLGANRTLVLVDGRRRVSGALNGSQVDLTAFPASMVESIEIITGGASAIYGADAVSGVVNVKLKHDFEGLALDARVGTAEAGDGETYMVSLHGGGRFADDKGSASFGMSAQESKTVFQKDRSYAFGRGKLQWVNNPANTGPADGIPDNIMVPDVHVLNIPYDPTFVIAGTRYIHDESGLRLPLNAGPCFGTSCIGGPDGYNDKERILRTPRKGFSAIADVSYEIAPTVKLFAGLDFSYAETASNGQSFFDSAITLSRQNPTLPAAVTGLMDANGLSTLTIGLIEDDRLGNKQYKNSRHSYTALAGLRGTLADRFDWEAFYQYGRRTQRYEIGNTRIESRFLEAVDVIADPVTGAPVCRSASARAAGCSPISFFSAQPPSQAEKAYFGYTFARDVTNTQDLAGLQLTGALFDLPAGSVRFAAGAEYRKDALASLDDGLGSRGLLYRTDNGGGPTDESVSVSELFAEAVVPVLKDLPLVRALSIESALRWSDYSTIGETLAWKAGMTWSPLDDVRVRFTRSKSVRAPTVFDLFGPQTRGIVAIPDDPCDAEHINGSPTREANCRALGIPVGWVDPGANVARVSTLGGNPELNEEESDSWSAGVVLTPSAVPGLRFSADYWSIDIENAVQVLSGVDIVDKCVDSPTIDNVFCPLVRRGNFSSVADSFVVSQVDLRQINVGALTARGVDLTADYRLPLGSIVASWPGDITLSLSAVHLIKLEELVDADDPTSLLIEDGEFDDPHWRGNFRIGYANDGLSAAWDIRYIGSAKTNVQVSREFYSDNGVSSIVYHDLFARYELSSNVQLQLGVNNVFDKEPPRTPDTYRGAFDGSLYDGIGRFYFFGASMKY